MDASCRWTASNLDVGTIDVLYTMEECNAAVHHVGWETAQRLGLVKSLRMCCGSIASLCDACGRPVWV